MSANLGKQLIALVTVGSFLTRMGIQPGGVIFGGAIGFTAGAIAAKDYGLNYEEVSSALNAANNTGAQAAAAAAVGAATGAEKK